AGFRHPSAELSPAETLFDVREPTFRCINNENDYRAPLIVMTRIKWGLSMRDCAAQRPGIRAYRKAAAAIAGTTLLIGSGAQAQSTTGGSEAAPDGQGGDRSIVVTSQRERRHTEHRRPARA